MCQWILSNLVEGQSVVYLCQAITAHQQCSSVPSLLRGLTTIRERIPVFFLAHKSSCFGQII